MSDAAAARHRHRNLLWSDPGDPRRVSWRSAQGRIVTVLGANGAGKTTCLRTISGVLDPERGQVLFEGRDIARMPPDRVMRLGICHVPEGREVFPFLTVHENLMMGAYTRRDTRRCRSATSNFASTISRVLKERAAPACRPAVRRRAADAGDQPSADGAAEAVAAR